MAERASPKQKIDDQACQGRQDAGDHKDRDEDLWKRKENGDAQQENAQKKQNLPEGPSGFIVHRQNMQGRNSSRENHTCA